jgi:hypothetical protein
LTASGLIEEAIVLGAVAKVSSPSFATLRSTTNLYNSTVIKNNVPIGVSFADAGSMGIIQGTIGSPRFLEMSVYLTF